MKKSIIASIVLASLASTSAFAVTDYEYTQDKYKLQQGIDNAKGIADEATTQAKLGRTEAAHAEASAVKAQDMASKVADRVTGVENSVQDAKDNAGKALEKAGQAVTAANKAEGVANNAATAVKDLEGKVDANKKETDAAISDLSTTVAGGMAQLDEHDERISNNSDAIAQHDIAISDLAGKAGENASRLDKVEGIADENTVNIGKNSDSIKGLQDDVAVHEQAIIGNSQQIGQNEAAIATNKDNIATNKKGIETNAADIKTNKADIATNAAGVAANKAGVETNAKNIETNKQVAKDYTDKTAKQTLNSANYYTDVQVGAEATARVEGDRQTLQSANAYTNQKFAQLDKRIGKVRNEANAGTASALAASQIPQVEATGRFSLGAGIGGYNNQQAVAVGFSSRITGNTVTKFAVTADTQHNVGFGAGVAVSW